MAKKIRFSLILAKGAQVRSMEELREHFDLEAILGYYKNGKLLTWLEDRYLVGEAKAIRALDEAAPDFQLRLCDLLGAEYTGADVDLEAIRIRQERLTRLRTVTDEDEFLRNIDSVAFDQKELADLLDEELTAVYLCGECFTVPASRKGVTYVGINEPEVKISGELPENFDELGITFRACKVDRPESLKPELLKQDHRKEVPRGAKIVAVSMISPNMGIINGWQDIVSITGSDYGLIGIKRDGDVVVESFNSEPWAHILKGWNQIHAVAWGSKLIAGLRKDGTVTAQFYERPNSPKRHMVDAWTDIIAVACGENHTVGLHRDGTVTAAGNNSNGQCNVQHWKEIVAIACTWNGTFGLKQDGTVVGTDYNYGTQSWTDVVSIDCGQHWIAGLKREGTVVFSFASPTLDDLNHWPRQTSGWRNIISVACGDSFIAGLRHDGTVVIAAMYSCMQEAQKWENVVSIVAGAEVLVGIVGPEVSSSIKSAAETTRMPQETFQQNKIGPAYVISSNCVCCGACADSCPVEAIFEDDFQYVIDADMCIKCGVCADICPVNAILWD